MKLFNTLTGEEELFEPYDGKTVKMYVCGVTPYSSTHVGHALSYVVFDTLRRYLEYLGYEVKHVQNFTDVDDKIIQRANEEGITGNQLTDRFIGDFFATMDRFERTACRFLSQGNTRDTWNHRYYYYANR